MGIGGIGMSGLAEICLLEGYLVSGCDSKMNSLSHRLNEKGADISISHDVEHLRKKPDLLVYSSAISSEEPELVQARNQGIRTITHGNTS